MADTHRPVALVTGASAGIGSAFAERLARDGYDLVLVARRRDRLEALAARLKPLGAQSTVVDLDLTAPEALSGLRPVLESGVDMLVNNAGFGTYGLFADLPIERQLEEIRLNVSALVGLAHAALPAMLARGRGTIVNVASTAAFQPIPYMAVYGATKAFVLSFSEALFEEYRARGITVVALCPGPTETEFFGVAGPEASVFRYRRTAEAVVVTALRAVRSRRNVAIDGFANRLLAFSIRFSPRRLVVKIVAAMLRPRAA